LLNNQELKLAIEATDPAEPVLPRTTSAGSATNWVTGLVTAPMAHLVMVVTVVVVVVVVIVVASEEVEAVPAQDLP